MSIWLGPPFIQSRMHDRRRCGSRGRVGGQRLDPARGRARRPRRPRPAGATGGGSRRDRPRSDPMADAHGRPLRRDGSDAGRRTSMVEQELGAVEQRPEDVGEGLRAGRPRRAAALDVGDQPGRPPRAGAAGSGRPGRAPRPGPAVSRNGASATAASVSPASRLGRARRRAGRSSASAPGGSTSGASVGFSSLAGELLEELAAGRVAAVDEAARPASSAAAGRLGQAVEELLGGQPADRHPRRTGGGRPGRRRVGPRRW